MVAIGARCERAPARNRWLAALGVVGAWLACARPPAEPADLVLRGGAIYTVDSAQPWAEAVAVRAGRIVYVGSSRGARRWIGADTRVVELGDGMLLPGFHDTHVHPVTGGIELGECDLNPAETRHDVVRIVTECVRASAGSPWVRGGGWQAPIFRGGSPSRDLLDSLVPDRPAYLTAADGHSAWVNSRALAIARVTRATRDPTNGRIDRDASGAPSGTLRETAMELVARVMPTRTDEEHAAGLARGLAMAASHGITTLHEASADEAILRAYATADANGTLTARVIVSLRVDPDRGVSEVARLAALRERYRGTLAQPIAAKIFADGVIEGQTAALLEPYLDRPGYLGELNVDPDSMATLVTALDSAGFKVHVHAIGDRAIRTAFDAFQRARERNGDAGPRHLMAHIQLFHPTDIPRFATLGVVASFQPLWSYYDSYIEDLTEPRLGPERSRWLYPFASVVETGAIVAAGSDWSVSSMNPLRGMEVAVTRRAPGDTAGTAWIPEERVDLPTIVRAYTMGGAYASDSEALTGSIEVGKLADLVVLDRNLFMIPAHEIHTARVVLTVLEGREVYRDSTHTPRR